MAGPRGVGEIGSGRGRGQGSGGVARGKAGGPEAPSGGPGPCGGRLEERHDLLDREEEIVECCVAGDAVKAGQVASGPSMVRLCCSSELATTSQSLNDDLYSPCNIMFLGATFNNALSLAGPRGTKRPLTKSKVCMYFVHVRTEWRPDLRLAFEERVQRFSDSGHAQNAAFWNIYHHKPAFGKTPESLSKASGVGLHHEVYRKVYTTIDGNRHLFRLVRESIWRSSRELKLVEVEVVCIQRN
ncbi:Protein of unknown function [Gryllus bimaculatus]|nr:Protein of unknown function [Gryllus bimaculatus]